MKFKKSKRDYSEKDKAQKSNTYRSPKLVLVGKAVHLVQGYSSGKRSDGYSGYYWE